ncbi:DoxX family membrane protein [Allomuricauda sp. d1]|uniref:DoxX family protein n=1 Tax=Allomuricauda sp. d1 TaxID=3136725 RepID=UPI0031CEE80A
MNKSSFKRIDQHIAKQMKLWGMPALRISFAIIFFWFGILKPFGLSAAEGLLKATVAWLPFGSPEQWLSIIGWWEVVIGITFLFRLTTRIAIALLFIQMVGTFMPLVILPEVTFQDSNILMPTIEGQYIIKNLMVISAALVIGGSFYEKKSPKAREEKTSF